MRSDIDVVVIGGGLAGTALLRELAYRGARAILFEKHDLGSGGSSLATGTIDVAELVPTMGDPASREVRARESAILLRAAPHLAASVPVIAVAAEGRRGASLLARWDAMLALRARRGETTELAGIDARTLRAREPAIALDDADAAVLTTRVRLDAPRLAIAYARDAMERGAEVRVRQEVVSVVADAGKGARVSIADTESGERSELHARAVVVATGAWPIPGRVEAAKEVERSVHVVFDHAITAHAIVAQDESLVPFHGLSVMSGRAARFAGAPGEPRVTRDEVRALTASLGRFVPDVRAARIVATFASVRRGGASLDPPSVTPPGALWVIPPGTPWDARARAETIATRVAAHLGIGDDVGTRSAKLPGGEEIVDSFDVAERLAMPEPAARRLTLRHGARCIDIGSRIGKRRTEASVVCACDPVLEAEVRHAVRVEQARDVGDVCRRTQLGIGPCGGMRCAHRAAEIVASERGLSPREARTMARRFLLERWHARAPGLDAAALAQEELAHARWVGASGLDVDREESET